MERNSGLKMLDGKEILTNEYVESLRLRESGKKLSKCFIAQKGAQEADLHINVDILVTGGNRGGGKANPKSTLVVTPSGYRRLGDLEVGDEICTPYEGVQQVKGIYDQGVNTVYHFYFDDGTKVVVMDNHRFLARIGSEGFFREMTAREIMNEYRLDAPAPNSLRQGHFKHVEIPLCGEVRFRRDDDWERDLPIHPFLLGIASAKGTMLFDQKGLRLTSRQFDFACLWKLGYKAKKHEPTNIWYMRGFTEEQRRAITNRRVEIESFIPEAYMRTSPQWRWEYLRGVWTANAHMRRCHPIYESPNRNYVNQLAEMMRSLGGWVSVTEITDKPEMAGWLRLMAVMPNDKSVFTNLNYIKLAKVNTPVPTSPDTDNILTKKLIRVRKSQVKEDCRCIEVTGRDHLYITENYVVNHNTVTMLTKPLYDLDNKHFNGIILRRNKDDFENIINESIRWFGPLGKYNKSKDDMTWNFNSGAKLKLSTYDMPLADFDVKYRGQQFAYIGVDELPQMPFDYFKFLMTCSRNTIGVRSQILGTCNPDPLSWLRKFLDWWIGKEDTIYSDGRMHPELKGFIIPERDGVIRYCYMPDDNVENIIWGDTPDEVYEQCRDIIDKAWDPKLEEFGYDKKSFAIKSVTFIKASLYDNVALLKHDPAYIANLLNQPPEIRMREFDGNWDAIKMGDDMIQAIHFDKVFHNAQMLGDGIRRASCDVAGTGGDNCVTWFWIGWHVSDVFVCRIDPYHTPDILAAKLEEWGVLEENFTYDLNGMGQVLKGKFPRAVPFNNQEAVPDRYKYMYGNIKSMAAYLFAQKSQQGEWSINPALLDRTFLVGKTTMRLYNILQTERKAIKQDMSKADRGWFIIPKEQMKNAAVVGHSPDFIEALFERMVFEIKRKTVEVPSWLRKKTHGGGRNITYSRKIGFAKR